MKINEIEHFSITDHDTYDNELNAFFLSEETRPYPGLELYTKNYEDNKKVHFLVYNFNKDSRILKEYIDTFKAIRNENSLKAVKNLKDIGYEINIAPLQDRMRQGLAVYKQNIMKCLIEAGYTDQVFGELYYKLKKDKIFFDLKYISYKEGLSLIKDIGGIAVLAHPGLYGNWNIMDKLIKRGLSGIEAYHPKHSQKDREYALKIAADNNLFLAGGSDYHAWENEKYEPLEVEEELMKDFIKVLKND